MWVTVTQVTDAGDGDTGDSDGVTWVRVTGVTVTRVTDAGDGDVGAGDKGRVTGVVTWGLVTEVTVTPGFRGARGGEGWGTHGGSQLGLGALGGVGWRWGYPDAWVP
ncbi:uncharacterized protein ACIBXB_004112 isoform 1-T1 [Morphnus guianensis]